MEPRPADARGRVPVVLAVMVVAALVSALLALAGRGGGDDDDAAGGSESDLVTPTTVPGQPPTADDLDAVVAELSSFVAGVRELDFRQPVEVTLLPADEFAARVREDAVADDPAELAESARVFSALGLLRKGTDLQATLLDYLSDTVVGFYDPERDVLVLRGGTITPYVRAILVHELVHALDDQHFELGRPALDAADDERGLAFSTLVEGDAIRIQEAYEATLTDDERSALTEEQSRIAAGIDLGSVPVVVQQLVGFPYLAGPTLVEHLLGAGGERRVDDAFAAPPATSEQALAPAAWLAGDAEPVDVAPPAADAPAFDQGVIGEWGLIVVLGVELEQGAARTAAAGWGGDWYVAWDDGGRTCVRATFVMDSPDDLDELATALDAWASNQVDASLDRTDDVVTFTSCA